MVSKRQNRINKKLGRKSPELSLVPKRVDYSKLSDGEKAVLLSKRTLHEIKGDRDYPHRCCMRICAKPIKPGMTYKASSSVANADSTYAAHDACIKRSLAQHTAMQSRIRIDQENLREMAKKKGGRQAAEKQQPAVVSVVPAVTTPPRHRETVEEKVLRILALGEISKTNLHKSIGFNAITGDRLQDILDKNLKGGKIVMRMLQTTQSGKGSSRLSSMYSLRRDPKTFVRPQPVEDEPEEEAIEAPVSPPVAPPLSEITKTMAPVTREKKIVIPAAVIEETKPTTPILVTVPDQPEVVAAAAPPKTKTVEKVVAATTTTATVSLEEHQALLEKLKFLEGWKAASEFFMKDMKEMKKGDK